MNRCVLITGATGAIGGALALTYAASETTLILQGRDQNRLAQLSLECQACGATVFIKTLDMRDTNALIAWTQEMCLKHTPDLVIVNAGMNTHVGTAGELEPWREVEVLLDINLKAAMAMAHVLVPYMRAKESGQIAFVSSLAAYFGLPVTPTYCASKAGLKAYGEALRGLLLPDGIKINVIMPGYVASKMCDAMPGPKPFLWSARRAAQTIKRGLERNKARISFPFPLSWGTWWLGVLPTSLSIYIVRWLGYGR